MMPYPFLWLFGIALVATVAAMPVARRLGAKAGLLDHPHARKLQTSAVPRTGACQRSSRVPGLWRSPTS